MATWLAILLIIVALIGGLVGGFFLARKYDGLFENHLLMKKCYV